LSVISLGTLTSITNFASSVSRNMERLSFDVDHIQRSEILRRHKPSHVSEGLRNGLSGLGLSILGVFPPTCASECVVNIFMSCYTFYNTYIDFISLLEAAGDKHTTYE